VNFQEKQRNDDLQRARQSTPNSPSGASQRRSDAVENQGRNFGAENDYAKRYADNRLRMKGNKAVDDNESKSENKADHGSRLKKAREGDGGKKKNANAQTIKELNNLRKNVSPMGALSLTSQIDFLGDIPIFMAFLAAILKDVSDFAFIGSLPGLGSVISICCAIFIAMMVFLVGAGEKKKITGKWMKKLLTQVGGMILELIPAINFIPVETITVGVVYFLILSDRKNAKE
jgi:hypothetical protein